jgi:hypothetical protein
MVCVSADLTQSGDNFETDPNGDHEWDGDSLMTCSSCNYCSASRQFDQGISEEQALARILRHLAKLGWMPVEVYDEDDPSDLSGMSVDEVVEECRAFSDCRLRVSNDGKVGSIYLVWGNSPMELIADHTTRWGLDEAVDAALYSIWPLYPDHSSEIAAEVQ